MRKYHLLGGVLGTSIAASILAIAIVQPARAQSTEITGVQVISSGGGIQLILETTGGAAPQVFTINRGNDVVADLVNTTLNLSEGGTFRENNPAPGISSIVVTPLDSNSVRVIVSGSSSPPNVDIAERSPNRTTINYGTGIAGAPGSPPPPANNPAPVAQQPPTQIPQQSQEQPDVLVPNPELTINGLPVPSTGPTQAPPFLPRAVAPPVGDIAVSNTNPFSSEISLGTSERVNDLVMKDAPVREALSVLARLAGLNVAYAGFNDPDNQEEPIELTISLDIEDESIENVFNYILRLSDLQANRVGNTIFVGVKLPESAQNIITRSLRINQANVAEASGFLSAQGAETQRVVNRTRRTEEGEGANRSIIEETTTEIIPLGANVGNGPLLLRGLSVLTDERLNTITLVGDPAKVDMATQFLIQLDARKRQVAVNVKIVDVNLSNEDTFNTSFSFGINDSFFVSDSGAAAINFGGVNPPSNLTVTGGTLVPSVIRSPLRTIQGITPQELEPFYETGQIRVPLTAPGEEGGSFLRPIAPLAGDRDGVFQPGVSEYTPFELNLDEGTLDALGDATFGLPTLFEYPTKFLALLEAQVVSRNAKILTDPTVVVQEGETASVGLTQDVLSKVDVTITDTNAGQRETRTPELEQVGLTLELTVSQIDDNGFVTLSILPEVSSPIGTEETGQGGFVTLVQRRELNSGTIRLRDGQTLILSGIIQEQERSTVTKWPILGDLPIIGSLFRGSSTTNERAEVIVLVTPQILDDSDRAGYGYGYVPGQDAQEIINRNR